MISSPEDYGLSAQQTLAFTYDEQPPDEFESFWSNWRDAVSAVRLKLVTDLGSAGDDVEFESLGGVRVIGRLTPPNGVVRGAVVRLHGYVADDGFADDIDPWTTRGLAVLQLRVRGFPPSIDPLGDLRGQWILHQIHDARSWILNGAVADVTMAVRALRHVYRPSIPIVLHGESLGGGLAVIAAAQLERLNEPIDRLVLGLPTFGAWSWRAGRYCNGSGGQVNMLLDALRGDTRDELLRTLRLFDAVHHARHVTVPTLCKLACRDDVVPAPTAAAVFNALASTSTARFVTRFGHYDGGIADARRHVEFERLHPGFAEPDRSFDTFLCENEPALNHTPSEPPNRL